MLSYRNGFFKHILSAVKGFNAGVYHSQHPRGRMPEKLLQILAPSKKIWIDQIYSPNLLWSEMSTSFLRKGQTCVCYHNSNIVHKRWTLGLLCADPGIDPCFPSIHAKCRINFCLSSQKQDLHVPSGGNVSYGETTVPGSPAPFISCWCTLAGLHTEGEGVLSAEELQSWRFPTQGKMWPPVPFNCKWCWAHFSPPGYSIAMFPPATYRNFQWE